MAEKIGIFMKIWRKFEIFAFIGRRLCADAIGALAENRIKQIGDVRKGVKPHHHQLDEQSRRNTLHRRRHGRRTASAAAADDEILSATPFGVESENTPDHQQAERLLKIYSKKPLQDAHDSPKNKTSKRKDYFKNLKKHLFIR